MIKKLKERYVTSVLVVSKQGGIYHRGGTGEQYCQQYSSHWSSPGYKKHVQEESSERFLASPKITRPCQLESVHPQTPGIHWYCGQYFTCTLNTNMCMSLNTVFI